MRCQPFGSRGARVGLPCPTLYTLLLTSLLVGGCRPESPEPAPRPDSVAIKVDSATPQPVVGDTARSQSPEIAPGYWTGAGTAPEDDVAKERREVHAVLDGFLTTVQTGGEADFRSRLAARSVDFLKDFDVDNRAFSIAKDALGSIRDRRITFLGGTRDSAALLVRGMRKSEDTLLPAAMIISVLREDGAWKVMYPGAQPYDEHVGP